METIAGEGLPNLGLWSTLRAFEQGGSLSCHTCCDMGPRFLRSHPKDRFLRHTRVCGESTLARILTGLIEMAFTSYTEKICMIMAVRHISSPRKKKTKLRIILDNNLLINYRFMTF
jgi:hypothetical protein